MKHMPATLLLSVVLLLGGLRPSPARADIGVGDEPHLEFTSVDGTPVSLAKLRGKMVIVDFWATWCRPCMAEAGHMVQVNQRYHDQGLQFIGISLDQDKGAMIGVAKQNNFAWPQYFDGQVWNNKLAKLWGVNSIPRTFLIGPDGKVLWTGHPANIDRELEKAFKEHPPQLVDPVILADANAALEKANIAMKAGNTRAALQGLSKIPADASKDKEFASKLEAARSALEAEAAKMLETVDPLIKQGDYVQAVSKLKELSSALEGSATGKKANARLAELSGKPEVKAALAKAERARQADAALDSAQKLKAGKKDAEAYAHFKSVAKDYPDTDAGTKAAAAVQEYEKDPSFVKRANEAAAARKAASAMKVAQSYVTAGRPDLARKKYQEIIDQFPGTSYAEQAKKAIAALAKQ
jgi:thiol-disulfide isomerase/thioredoxin